MRRLLIILAIASLSSCGKQGESVLYDMLEKGRAEQAAGRYDDADATYQSLLFLAQEAKDSLAEAECLRSYAAMSVERPDQDPQLAVDMLQRAVGALGLKLSREDMGVLSYSHALLGNTEFSHYWLLKQRHEPVEDSSRLAALRAMEALVLLLLGVAASLLWYIKARRMQAEKALAGEQAERERYMTIAEDLQNRLSKLQSGKKGGKNRFDVLERLCEQYYVYEGTENLQPKVLKEVKSIVDGLRSDSKVHRELEKTLDEDYDGVMTKLRAAFPGWKEEDFLLYAFVASGFSSTTISLLLSKDKPYVYNRIYRLKGRIASSDVEGAGELLKVLEKQG